MPVAGGSLGLRADFQIGTIAGVEMLRNASILKRTDWSRVEDNSVLQHGP